jgi:hypothetical protein
VPWLSASNFSHVGHDFSRHAEAVGDVKRREKRSRLMPPVHRVVSLLKRWLLGTHQGGVAYYYLPYYLDEFTFRFNRWKAKSRGKLSFQLRATGRLHAAETSDSQFR